MPDNLVAMGTKLFMQNGLTWEQIPDLMETPGFLGLPDSVELPAMDRGYKGYAPGQVDPGDMVFKFLYSGVETGTNWATLRAKQLAKTKDYYRIVYPDESGFQWAAKVAVAMDEASDPNSPVTFSNKHFVNDEILPLDEVDQVATPVATPGAGAVASGAEVSLSCATAGADIYYTIDGSTPTSASSKYTAAIAITAPVTIKALACKAGMETSETLSAAYTISGT